MRMILAVLCTLALSACSQQAPEREADTPRRIISLDYCADQYVLKFADRDDILALSPDATKHFSYMSEEAKGLPQVRPRAADVLALEPDLVVRSYGGGPNMSGFMQSAGVPVVQIGFPGTIDEVRGEVLRIGRELGKVSEAEALTAEMDQRLAALAHEKGGSWETLYMTPTGYTAGGGTLVHELIRAAGLANFQKQSGWNPLPLERLAYEQPDLVAPAFFGHETGLLDSWSAARHPIAQAQLRERPVVPLEGAWTSCGGWFLLDAVEALARHQEAQ